jgi:chaperone BCS1
MARECWASALRSHVVSRTTRLKSRSRLSTFLGSHALLQDFLKAAEELHTAQDRGKLRIFSPRSKGYEAGSWGQSASKPGRPWDSVVLPEKVKEDLLEDAMEFLDGEAFYRERGLPYRRGYLLYGVPGSGKTSLGGWR